MLANGRRLAAFALLACFFLPLSKCTSSSQGGAPMDDYRFPFEHVTQAVDDFQEQGTLLTDSLPLLLVTLVVFLAPIAVLKLGTTFQSIAHIVLAAPAEWLLYEWSTIGQMQIGGVLAMLSWAVLFVVGAFTLWKKLSHQETIDPKQ